MTLFILRKSIVLEEYIEKDYAEKICEILSLERKIVSDMEIPPTGCTIKFKDNSWIVVQKENLFLNEKNLPTEIEIIEESGIFLSDELREPNIKFVKNILEAYKQNWEITIEKDWEYRL